MQNDNHSPDLEQDVNNNQDEQAQGEAQNQSNDTEQDRDWKAEALKYKAILDRNKDKKPEAKEAKAETNGLDYGAKAYLLANGIKGKQEMDLVNRLKEETGKDIDSLLETTYFQSELKNLREEVATDNALPKGNGKGNQTSVDSVEYWLAKGELPPASEVELRRKVVNARIKKEESRGQFYNS